ncbi:hypothetical protein HNQ77_001172 [Silvibacterium bohemicum]|uniref:Glycoside hydrolase family 5 domain-containing protein n=1 Tax=Silvibacterium bohemicum TaxID=1577686 RepID=A0A841JXR1_9BACT|nr:hypothetical protein [Silvibacterium bohemicum]MBB6143228.1 hypothetical protein [Silvibacterium bohemicum]
MVKLFSIVLLFLLGVFNSPAQTPEDSPESTSSDIVLDHFDHSKNLHHWSFSNGPEFPGSDGSLSLGRAEAGSDGPEENGRHAILTYRFTCSDRAHCGHYVAATWTAPAPIEVKPGAALTVWTRFSPDVDFTVRVQDLSGQTLQFSANGFTLEHQEGGEGQRIVIPITGHTDAHWGGANSGQLQGKIVSIAILANARYPRPAQGQMEFDDLRLISTAGSALSFDPAAALSAAPESAGELRPRLGVDIHFLSNDALLDRARAAGFSFVRMDLPWARLEKDGQYDFTPFDALMQSLEARYMGVLWLLAYGHPDHGGSSPQTPEDIATYARYAAAVVAHYRGHHVRYEIWNEPNQKKFLANSTVYPDLLRAALDAIRREDPAAQVSTGGTSGFDLPFISHMLDSGSAQKASAIAVHPYRDAAPETLPADLIALKDLVAGSTGQSLPVWETEWGYASYARADDARSDGHSDAGQRKQAILAVRECLTTWALGLPVAVWYDLRDDGQNALNQEHNFGLLHRDGSDKPAMQALQALSKVAANRRYVGLVRDVPSGLHAMRLDGPEDSVFVLWSENEASARMQFSSGQVLSFSNMFGEPMTAASNENDQKEIDLNESMGPVYARFKRQ